MVTAGFTFSTSGLYICVLQGDKTSPQIKYKDKIILPKSYSVRDLVEWFEIELNPILKRHTPDSVTYKLTINNITNDFVGKVFYGQAILNLLCSKNNIEIQHCSPSSVVNSRFNLSKEDRLHDFIDNLLGNPPSPWDAKMKDTALMALKILN